MGVMGKVFVFFLKLFSKNPAQGAATSVFAATAPELGGHSGTYLANCAVGVDPVWWTPTLSQMGVEKVPHVEDGNEEAGPARPHARVQG
jgi:hypothetical protein